jgi:hypothetical protein
MTKNITIHQRKFCHMQRMDCFRPANLGLLSYKTALALLVLDSAK